jgi:hypothetical protein
LHCSYTSGIFIPLRPFCFARRSKNVALYRRQSVFAFSSASAHSGAVSVGFEVDCHFGLDACFGSCSCFSVRLCSDLAKIRNPLQKSRRSPFAGAQIQSPSFSVFSIVSTKNCIDNDTRVTNGAFISLRRLSLNDQPPSNNCIFHSNVTLDCIFFLLKLS